VVVLLVVIGIAAGLFLALRDDGKDEKSSAAVGGGASARSDTGAGVPDRAGGGSAGSADDPEPGPVDPDRAADGSSGDPKVKRLCDTIGAAEFTRMIPRAEPPRNAVSTSVSGFTAGGCSTTQRYDSSDPYHRSLSVNAESYTPVRDVDSPQARCQSQVRQARQSIQRDQYGIGVGRLEDAANLGADAFLQIKETTDGGTSVRAVACRGTYYVEVSHSVSPLDRSAAPEPEQKVRTDAIAFTNTVLGKLQG
jgi:hypothetical protein